MAPARSSLGPVGGRRANDERSTAEIVTDRAAMKLRHARCLTLLRVGGPGGDPPTPQLPPSYKKEGEEETRVSSSTGEHAAPIASLHGASSTMSRPQRVQCGGLGCDA